MKNRNQRRVSERLDIPGFVLGVSDSENVNNNAPNRPALSLNTAFKPSKRNSYNVGNLHDDNSRSLLKHPNNKSQLNVSEERSSGRQNSNNDYSNGHQGTLVNSPGLKSQTHLPKDQEISVKNMIANIENSGKKSKQSSGSKLKKSTSKPSITLKLKQNLNANK